MKRTLPKFVICLDQTKIVKKVVEKPCQFITLPTELTVNSEDVPGQPKHENHMKIPFEVRLAKQPNQLFSEGSWCKNSLCFVNSKN